MVAAMIPAGAQTADSARAFSFGIDARLSGSAILDQLPNCTAVIPPGAEDFCDDEVLEVPVQDIVESATLAVTNEVATAGGRSATLAEEINEVSSAFPVTNANARSFAVTEDLSVLDGTVSADVIEGEALAACLGNQTVFASGANVADLQLSDTEILQPILDALEIDLSVLDLTQAPNTRVIDLAPLLRVTFWETNWDGSTGTTDNSDTVFVNALRIEALTGDDGGLLDLDDLLGGGGDDLLGGGGDDLLGGGGDDLLGGGGDDLLGGGDTDSIDVQQTDSTVDIRISHAEASADCDAAAPPLGPGGPLGGITKNASSEFVAPGSNFTYTIDVPNRDPSCTLTGVRVVDTITGPAGSTIVSTDPPADNIDGLTVTYNDIGPIAPGQSVRLTIGVSVPANAPDGARFSEQLRVDGNCDGQPVQGGLDFTGPTVRAPAGPGGPGAPLPRTGATALLGGLAFMALGAGLLRMRG